MKIQREEEGFRPVTLILETRDEFNIITGPAWADRRKRYTSTHGCAYV